MIDGSSLFNLSYFKEECFRRGKKGCSEFRSGCLKELENDLKVLDDNNYSFPIFHKLKREIILKTIELSYNTFPFKNRSKKLWIGPLFNQYSSAFNSIPYNLIASHVEPSFNSFLKLFKSNLSFHPISNSCYVDIYSGIIHNDEECFQQGLYKLEKRLIGLNLDLILMHSDIVPINQAIVLVARELGIPTVELQHGIYSGKYIPNGLSVDYLFVWGQYFKDLYVKNKLKKEDQIKILGYPFNIIRYPNHDRERKIVTYLGQSFEVQDKDLISYKVKAVQSLQRICNNLNFDFIFRPHPRDNLTLLKSEIKNVKFTPQGETLNDTIEKGDIFIAFNSTSLVEANLNSKLSIQLKSYDLPTDDFEKIGACTKSVETFEELEEYLKQIKEMGLSSLYRPVKESYLKIPSPDLGTRFYELIEEII